jgi:hypothetical protein
MLMVDFLKVVSTRFVYLSGDAISSNQYSVTQYERDLRQGNAPGRDGHARELAQTGV